MVSGGWCVVGGEWWMVGWCGWVVGCGVVVCGEWRAVGGGLSVVGGGWWVLGSRSRAGLEYRHQVPEPKPLNGRPKPNPFCPMQLQLNPTLNPTLNPEPETLIPNPRNPKQYAGQWPTGMPASRPNSSAFPKRNSSSSPGNRHRSRG